MMYRVATVLHDRGIIPMIQFYGGSLELQQPTWSSIMTGIALLKERPADESICTTCLGVTKSQFRWIGWVFNT